jgi:hypothetical protein
MNTQYTNAETELPGDRPPSLRAKRIIDAIHHDYDPATGIIVPYSPEELCDIMHNALAYYTGPAVMPRSELIRRLALEVLLAYWDGDNEPTVSDALRETLEDDCCTFEHQGDLPEVREIVQRMTPTTR